jgi:hypothetical protein
MPFIPKGCILDDFQLFPPSSGYSILKLLADVTSYNGAAIRIAMNTPTGFTFYGDLLGIGAAYRLSSDVAYSKLNTFYNTVFARFEPLCDQPAHRVHVQMFSDSVVMWGQNVSEILEPLQQVYLDLIKKNLLLRGALVRDALEKEPRVEAKNFRKFLPTNDTLARAVGLEKTVKGARLLIESPVAHKLLSAHTEWLTLEGYMDHLYPSVPVSSVLRRICPSPSGTCYELLYFWKPVSTLKETSVGGDRVGERLREMTEFQDPNVAEHLRETLKVLKRSDIRRRRTEHAFSAEPS